MSSEYLPVQGKTQATKNFYIYRKRETRTNLQ